MGEIKASDLQEIKTPEKQGFQEIRPQEGMTVQEADKIWDAKLSGLQNQDVSSEIDCDDNGIDCDDNGKEYRIGDNLIPDNSYEINGYLYKTDSEGRISSADGMLQMRSPDYRRNSKDTIDQIGKGSEKPDDERGHLIGHQFGGGDNLENMVPMARELNHGDYLKMETELADAVKDGADVRLKVEPIYEDDSYRPTEIRATYSIDGDCSVKVFRNGEGN